MTRVPHPTEISAWVMRQHPTLAVERPGSLRLESSATASSQFKPSLLASSYVTDSAAYTESFDDVQEMEEALDRYVTICPIY